MSTNFEMIVNLSNDYYAAYLTITIFNESSVITKEHILEALSKKNVSFGIAYDAIDRILANPGQCENELIAKGIVHEQGEDGVISYLFDKDMKTKPTLNEDGSVDFKNMNFLQTAYKGDVLATKTLPTEGKMGTTVTGKNIKPRPGKQVNFKFGQNVGVSTDGLQMLALDTGSIQVEGDKVTILKVLEIKNDVGVKTGNIEFNGKVVVNGNVTTGYAVTADDDIVINGIVEGATITTKGDLFINGGVQGHDQAKLKVKGNVVSKFINNAELNCKGNIEADAIMHSIVNCDGGIKVQGKRALLVGGEVNVRYDIQARVIGSEMGTQTKIRLGIDSSVMDNYQARLEDIKELKDTITKLSQASRMLRKQYDQTRSPEIKAMLDKTEVSRTDYTRQMAEAQTKLKEVSDLIESLKGSKIKVEEIYPGVKVRIGNSHYSVKSALSRVTILKDEGEIRAMSY